MENAGAFAKVTKSPASFLVLAKNAHATPSHGILRVLLLQPFVGDFRARQLTVFTGALLILTIAYLFSSWLGLTYPTE